MTVPSPEQRFDLRPDVGEFHRGPVDLLRNRLGGFEQRFIDRVIVFAEGVCVRCERVFVAEKCGLKRAFGVIGFRVAFGMAHRGSERVESAGFIGNFMPFLKFSDTNVLAVRKVVVTGKTNNEKWTSIETSVESGRPSLHQETVE